MKVFLLDAEYLHKKGEAWIRLLLKDLEGKSFPAYVQFDPYFYLKPSSDGVEKLVGEMKVFQMGEEIRVKKVEKAEKLVKDKKLELLKIICFNPGDVTALADQAKRFGEVLEHRIAFVKRFLIDYSLVPTSLIEAEWHEKSLKEGKKPKKIVSSLKQLPLKESEEHALEMNALAFDIETRNPAGLPRPEKDPCILMSYADGNDAKVLSGGKKIARDFVKPFGNEKEMLEDFARILVKKKIDVLTGYNSDQFDLPYVRKRAEVLKAEVELGRDAKKMVSKKLGMRSQTRISGRIHLDVFNVVAFLQVIGAIRPRRLTLTEVYKELFGEEKLTTEKMDIWKAWDAGGKQLEHLADYSLSDSKACWRIYKQVLPMVVQLSRVSGLTLFDASRAPTSVMVENLLMKRAFERGELIPSGPSGEVIAGRQVPVEGAFVKTPTPGIYENIVVFDFRSLYPSLIASHNIDPSTLNCDDCEDAFVSPQGHRFCRKRKGLIPSIIEEIMAERTKTRMELKKVEKNTDLYRQLDSRQWALKILLNSVYGYLLYARSRWYSREGGESTTGWAREFIQGVMKKAEEYGFNVLYGDTDSVFLLYEKGKEEKVFEFQKAVNEGLPKPMELELEDFYPRGIFVGRKLHKKAGEEKGAKKKYALMNKDAKIKIRGFELVRRDWSAIARNTQREVLEILLKEGDVEKASALVREKIEELKSGKVPLSELAINTQLRKKKGSYEIMSPELSAVQKAEKAGAKVEEEAMVSYVITKKGKTISEKAALAEFAEDYDADYYINNQLLPSVLKILETFGYDETGLKTGGKQQTLGGW